VKVSIVIPTLNAGPGFEETLKKISSQEGDFERELLVVDSGSTDGTAELARRYGARVHRIERHEFNHGATRNLGISLTEGEFVALTVQDAVPLDERWLAAMVEDLERDERVAVVYGRHVPRPDASVLTRALVNNLPTAALERREQEMIDPESYQALRPAEKRRAVAFDDVSSCLRRSVWEEFPFENTNFAEDLRWGKEAFERGYKIVYEPRSVVIHSHERGILYDLKRHYVDQMYLIEIFGASLVPNLLHLALTIPLAALRVYGILRRESPEKRMAHLRTALEFAVMAQVGAYLGCKSKVLASSAPGLHRFLSKGV
jgi:rhamnosyltransferase